MACDSHSHPTSCFYWCLNSTGVDASVKSLSAASMGYCQHVLAVYYIRGQTVTMNTCNYQGHRVWWQTSPLPESSLRGVEAPKTPKLD